MVLSLLLLLLLFAPGLFFVPGLALAPKGIAAENLGAASKRTCPPTSVTPVLQASEWFLYKHQRTVQGSSGWQATAAVLTYCLRHICQFLCHMVARSMLSFVLQSTPSFARAAHCNIQQWHQQQ